MTIAIISAVAEVILIFALAMAIGINIDEQYTLKFWRFCKKTKKRRILVVVIIIGALIIVAINLVWILFL